MFKRPRRAFLPPLMLCLGSIYASAAPPNLLRNDEITRLSAARPPLPPPLHGCGE